MKIAIVGSRDYHDMRRVIRYVKSLPPDTIVVSGNARGVDQMSEETARSCGLEVISIPARWEREDGTTDRSAGYKRNIEIIEQVETVIAFWDGKSKGTLHSITEAAKHDIRIIINPHISGEQS